MKAIDEAKILIARAAQDGISNFMRTEKGRDFFGDDVTTVQCTDSPRSIQVECRVDCIPTVFEFTVRELFGSNK